MYVPFYANETQYKVFIDSREIDIKHCEEAIKTAKQRIKDEEYY